MDYAAENAKRALAAMGLGSMAPSLDTGSQRLKSSMGLPLQTAPPSFRSDPPTLHVPSREELYPPAGNRSTDFPGKGQTSEAKPFWPSDGAPTPATNTPPETLNPATSYHNKPTAVFDTPGEGQVSTEARGPDFAAAAGEGVKDPQVASETQAGLQKQTHPDPPPISAVEQSARSWPQVDYEPGGWNSVTSIHYK